ncbi:malonyl-CoA decarboxylase [Thalassospira marina]|uniref:Malonyl-CoA decarboxylase n=1 Tax=Thalassospira marina TaxID=2048283 RepID=A0A2N3KG41_9PROT|nr:malonyl-CoA decarboxylase [Thalassospira marina]PKR49539.1 malonyl-CoA decarboxylase [Thalassospira marina]
MSQTFIDRTFDNIRQLWRDIRGNSVVRSFGFGDEAAQKDHWRRQVADCLAHRGGAVSARLRAAELGHDFLRLDEESRKEFLHLLVNEFDVDRARLGAVIRDWQQADDLAERTMLESRMRAELVPPYRKLLQEFNALPQGVKFLVDLRADLLRWRKDAPGLVLLEQDLKTLLSGWFDIGFLELHQITWNSPAALLEKLIAYEAVHQIRSWDDLKSRLASDRRCFAFFHPGMPDEPLIFVEVALVSGIAENVDVLIDRDLDGDTMDPSQADTAIFYSISNAQSGLAGISFGDFLIKRVVAELQRDLPNLRQFATLSPIPGFRRWLTGAIAEMDAATQESDAPQNVDIKSEAKAPGTAITVKTAAKTQVPERLFEDMALCRPLIAADVGGDVAQKGNVEQIDAGARSALLRLVAHYLLNERRAGRDTALDPVAHFHLTNGARVERLNMDANSAPAGQAQSFGLMVNYLYQAGEIEKNHENYAGGGKIAASSTVRRLAG